MKKQYTSDTPNTPNTHPQKNPSIGACLQSSSISACADMNSLQALRSHCVAVLCCWLVAVLDGVKAWQREELVAKLPKRLTANTMLCVCGLRRAYTYSHATANLSAVRRLAVISCLQPLRSAAIPSHSSKVYYWCIMVYHSKNDFTTVGIWFYPRLVY